MISNPENNGDRWISDLRNGSHALCGGIDPARHL